MSLVQGKSSAVPVSFAAAPAVTYASAPVSFAAPPVTYSAAPVSYSAAPVTYSAAPVTYAAAPTFVGAPLAYAAAPVAKAPESGVVQKAWDNHFAAFGSQDVEKILEDYSEASVITVYNQTDGSQQVYEGLTGARDCFSGLFAELSDLSDLTAPVIDVMEANGEEPGSVFLIWNCKASGYKEATDTFIFDANGKILRQNVVVFLEEYEEDPEVAAEEPSSTTGPVHTAWANHFQAFGSQSVEKILEDYVEDSVITVYNQIKGMPAGKTEYKGLDGVKECFSGLFKSLKNTKDLEAPVQHVEECSSSGPGHVFLIWSCPASGYKRATDTFIFNSSGKILRQNVVVAHMPKKMMNCC
jgi:hypothetical protein